jgi:glucose-1-phosphate cytidylyltransferase
VCDPRVLEYIADDNTIFEREPLEQLAREKQLYAFKHIGFWKPMDTQRDKNQLEELIESNTAPWVRW